MELPNIIWNGAPWSYSKANLAHTCPLSFHKKYIKKEKELVPVRKETQVGTVVHKILEWVDGGLSIDEAYAKAANHYSMTYNVSLEIHTFRDAVEDWVRGLSSFCNSFKIKRKIAEASVSLDGSFKVTRYRSKDCLIRGKIDLVLFSKGKHGVVVDHKTGAVKALELHAPQVELYSIMADALEPNLQSVTGAIHFVGADKNNKGSRVSWMNRWGIDTVRTDFRQRLIEFLVKAAEVYEQGDPQPVKSWLCDFCGYKPTCPLHS